MFVILTLILNLLSLHKTNVVLRSVFFLRILLRRHGNIPLNNAFLS